MSARTAIERHFQLVVQFAESLASKLELQPFRELPRGVGVLAGVVLHAGSADRVHRRLLLALSDQFRDRDVPVAEEIEREIVEAVRSRRGFEQVVGEHRIAGDARELTRRSTPAPSDRT